MSPRTRAFACLSRTAIASILVAAPALTGAQDVSSVKTLTLFEEVWRLTRDHFLDPNMNGLDWRRVREQYAPEAAAAGTAVELQNTINRMLGELGSSHTRLYMPHEPAYYQLLDIFYQSLSEQMRERVRFGPTYDGIGIVTRQMDGRWFVTGIVEGAPGHRSDLRVGDEILRADGEPFDPIGSFAGKVGKEVMLDVRRSLEPEEQLVVPVYPKRIRPSQMFLDAIAESLRIFSRNGTQVGYVRIWSYAGKEYHDALVTQIASGRLDAAAALVLDLRDGWGGASAEYLNVFNRNLPAMSFRRRDEQWIEFKRSWLKPVVVLVNEGTRSGKEIFTYGFKTYGYGPVVGTRTAGAVLGAEPLMLSDGSLLQVAAIDLQVDGRRLEGVGVEPDVVVPFDLRYTAGRDPQVERALAVAAGLVSATPHAIDMMHVGQN